MNTKLLALLFVGAVFGIGAGSASADSFRCGSYLAREGMDISDIVKICGQPAKKEIEEAVVINPIDNGISFSVGKVIIEHWTYDRGWGKFPARVTVENGIATEIKLISRASRDWDRAGLR